MSNTNTENTIEAFISNWNRSEWMAENGEWDADGGIAEGTIDPDAVEDDAEALEVSSAWQGWDCSEGWAAYRSDSALVLNWWRAPYPHTGRHQRDLWVVVDAEFFAAE